MTFNLDYTKPAHQVAFSHKRSETHHPLLMINDVSIKRVSFLEHLGLILDSKLDFNEHIKTVLSKVNKMIALLQKCPHVLSRLSLLTICKTFVRRDLDYGDAIYDKAFMNCFIKKMNLFNTMLR